MSFGVSGFTVPKRGSAASENQDAHLPRLFAPWRANPSEKYRQFPPERITVGVADGATEGILSGVWANLLLKSAAALSKKSAEPLTLESTVGNAARLWAKFKRHRSKGSTQQLTNLPLWLEEQALARGAFSTLCIATFTQDGRWSAFSVGDSCMFKVQNESMQVAWPISSYEDFGNTPYLISSEPAFNEKLEANARFDTGDWHPADKFYFATDALAAWILRNEREEDSPWRLLLSFNAEADPTAFTNFVEAERDKGKMRNDDVTLLRLDFVPNAVKQNHASSSASGI